MTQAELLNYILEKEKLKKEDLAKLLGISKKNTEKAFSGETPLTKRQIKNISEFIGIPEEVIKSGEIILPDLQNTGVVFIDEEFVKNQNTERFKNYIKNRFKIQFISLFLLKLSVYFILIFFSIFTGFAFYSAFIENIDKSTTFSAFFTLIPYLLGFASIVPMFKVIKKVNFNEVKRVKIYYYFIIVANLISLISFVALNANIWAFFGIGLFFTLIPLLFLILEKNKKIDEKQIKILSTVLMFAAFIVGYELVSDYPIEKREFYFVLVFIVLNIILLAAHICYWVIKDFVKMSNNFHMLNNKKCFKKRKIMRSLVSVLLVTTLVAGGVHFGSLYILKIASTYAKDALGENFEPQRQEEYNKTDIVFTNEDETITLETNGFTYKIPAELIDKTNKKDKSEDYDGFSHKNEAETITVVSVCTPIKESFSPLFSEFDVTTLGFNEEDSMFGESQAIFFSKYMEIVKNVLVEKYGFYPTNDYEIRKLCGMIDLEDINYWNKQEAYSSVFLMTFFSVIIPQGNEETYFYETEKLQGIIDVRKITNSETGEISYSYIYNFKKSDSEWLEFMVVVRLPEEVASTDLAYKIINSVEIK